MGEGALHPGTVTLIYERLVRQAFARKLLGAMSETELERWIAAVSLHSTRVGVAQDNFAAGESLPAIMQAYRWRDPKAVMRYGAKFAAKSSASARMAARIVDFADTQMCAQPAFAGGGGQRMNADDDRYRLLEAKP